ncbi:MAG: ComF family protein [Lachnospiraceae bacterium]|nr:ComF family protein [Lachnospiraceae bacterium]MDD7026983.1 ComF family protein [Lachnospiraceae bacterium]MDY5700318.1 ComF family protein [Lachnospiraceae bacterium]
MLKFDILDLLYPKRCALCDKVLPLGQEDICSGCKEGIRYLTGPLCCKCGKAVKEEEEYCFDCSRKAHWFKEGAALFPYDYIRTSLYRFKYGKRQEYGRFYARQMAVRLTDKVRGWKPQALVPVPLHKKKKRKRGYNQAQVLAEELSRIWQLPVLDDLVIRVKNTRPMKGIEGTERQNNLKKAFKLGRNDVKLNTIIVIDDIYTTGSTVDAVARVCRQGGIANVYVLSVSIGHGI